ncbi:MAG: DUF2848 family protein [Candidatus Jordarchaeaceae archaeon]
MKFLDLKVRSGSKIGELVFCVRRMINAGYTGRSQETVWKHVQELAEKGVPAPREIPTFYPVASYLILVNEKVEVVEKDNSGEAEYVVLIGKEDTYIGVGSDHTDRQLEGSSILKAKQICPNVMSREVWKYADVKNHWDELVLRSWVLMGSEKVLYQEAKLQELMAPEDLVSIFRKRMKLGNNALLENTVIFSGTVPLRPGKILSGEGFEVELYDPVRNESLRCNYWVEILDYI